MITLRKLPLVLGLTGTLSFPYPALAESRSISIKEVLETAAQSPEVKSAQAVANAASSNDSADWRKIYMPKLNANLSYSHLLQDQGFKIPSISTPLGVLPVPPLALNRDMTMGSIQLIQPLFDPENMLYSSDASKSVAEAEKLKASRQTKETQGKAISYYLQILELRSKRNALEKYVKNLKSRQPEIKRLYELGYVSESDVLKVKLGIDDANQGIRELLQKEDFLGQILASLLGETGTLSPEDLADDLPKIAVLSDSVDAEKREDILSLDKQIEALDNSKGAAKAAYLPKLAAFASHNYADTDLLEKKDWDTVGLLLTWSLFDSGVSLANSRASAEKQHALEQRRYLAIGAIRASYLDAVNTLRLKKQEYEERKAAVVEAKKVADLEFSRLKSGKTTINSLIDAEDVLKDRVEKASLSKTSWYQAWFGAQVASGDLISAP